MITLSRRFLPALALALGLSGAAFSQTTPPVKTQLQVYTTLLPESLADFKAAFEAENADIEIVWRRESTGTLTARIAAEGDNQRGDAIWGLAVTSMLDFKKRGLLIPYAPKNLAAIRPEFRDPDAVPSWVGMEAWAAAICFNTVEAAKIGLPKPQSWFDLLDPKYKGKITFSNPAASGTGYFHVSAWVQIFGEAKAWDFMEKLHPNVAIYEPSGTRPCRHAATGEFPVGISYELAGMLEKNKGAPIEVLLMKEGGGWDMDTAAILKGTRNEAAAKRLMDFAASVKANELYAKWVPQVAIAGIGKPPANYPEGVAASMIRNDFAWAAENRERILAEWSKRFEKK
ncbi:MAG: putative 2-aminoethylphosphonate ABC transporter substrate-binding protein [Proteobacteria bacterium]|nr:putative 2-aminoethylphosphonate ABC transporter substrate-binding protein [Pseudomonadota bacterium]